MNRIFIRAIIAAVCLCSVFTACKKELSDVHPSSEKVILRVAVPMGDETKVISGIDETAVNNYQVFLFDSDGSLEDCVSQSSPDIVFSCTYGKKTIVALVNAPSMADVTDYETLTAKQTYLSDNHADAFVMSGSTTIEIKSTVPDVVSIQVTRKVAKIELASLEVDIDIPQYSSLPFKVSAVYLINVPAEMPYLEYATATVWYNKMGYNAENDNTLIYDDMDDFEVTDETPYITRNTFYCYANHTLTDSFASTWTARCTRLVVEAMLGETKYYYPVTIPKVNANKKYEVNLKITRPGSLTPDTIINTFAAGVEVYIKDWQSGGSVDEEI